MVKDTRKHYRVAKRQIEENPYEGVYVTKEEHKKCFIITASVVALSAVTSLASLLLKSSK